MKTPRYMSILKKIPDGELHYTCCLMPELKDVGCHSKKNHGCVCANDRDLYMVLELVPLKVKR